MRIRSNHWINRQRDMVNGVQSCELDLTVPIEYLMEIRCFKNAVMRMYTNRESEKGIYTSVIYQYNTNNNMLETSLQVHNPLKSEQRVGEEERVEANLATEIMSGFIIEFIENNEVKSLFSQNDWGEYLLKDYGVTIL